MRMSGKKLQYRKEKANIFFILFKCNVRMKSFSYLIGLKKKRSLFKYPISLFG